MYKKPFKAVDGPKIMLYAFAFMLAAQLIVSIIILPMTQFAGNAAVEIFSFVGMISFQAVFLSVYLVYTKKHGIKSTFSPRNKITWWSIPAAILIAAICLFGFMGLAYYFDYLLRICGYPSQEMEITTNVSMVLIVFATVIAAPICEETIYRSALLSGVSKVTNELGACMLSGICFSLMHMNPEQTVLQFFLGFFCAYVVLKCRSVIPAMIMHATSNALALVLSFTTVGGAIDAFYMKIGYSILITLLLCVLLPIVACVVILLICKYLKKEELKKYPDKYNDPKVVWIDENTKEPIYEGGPVPVITEENRFVQKGFSPFTGAPVLVDRLELQRALLEEYKKEEKTEKKSYKIVLGIYFGLTIFLWLLTFGSSYLLVLME